MYLLQHHNIDRGEESMEMGNFGFLASMIVVEEGAAVPGGDTNGLHGEFIGSRAWESVAWMVDVVINRRARGRL